MARQGVAALQDRVRFRFEGAAAEGGGEDHLEEVPVEDPLVGGERSEGEFQEVQVKREGHFA